MLLGHEYKFYRLPLIKCTRRKVVILAETRTGVSLFRFKFFRGFLQITLGILFKLDPQHHLTVSHLKFTAAANKYIAFGKSLCTYRRCWK
jgi:hypothetical protein